MVAPNTQQPQQAPFGSNQGQSYINPRDDGVDFTFYDTEIAAIAPGASLSSQINIDGATDFYWVAATIQVDIGGVAFDGGVPIVPLIKVIITDGASQRQLMNQPVPVTGIFGTAQLPYRLIKPRLFSANAIITFLWTNYDAANTYHFKADLHGFRVPRNQPFIL